MNGDGVDEYVRRNCPPTLEHQQAEDLRQLWRFGYVENIMDGASLAYHVRKKFPRLGQALDKLL